MYKLIEKIKSHYKEHGYKIELIDKNEKSIKFNIYSNLNGKTYVEDLEISTKIFKDENFETIKDSFDYLIYNSLYRHLNGGDENVSDKD